ncbi:MAG TPA: cohesin domain-containing protein, partial [Anaerolineae bacterium]|nr:cohesin domain-containing protein [Anaerolineae bacterium]
MKRHPFITIISIIALLVLLWPANVWAQGPTIRFVPSTTTPKVGDTVNVDIRIENASNLYGAEVHVAFDRTRLEVLDDDPAQTGVQILPGSFFPKSDPSYVAV